MGLSGLDASLVDAELLNPELGQVGKPVRSDAQLLDLLTAASYLPVVACVAGDAAGNVYNVNADQMAVACAASFEAESLVFLTDVEGVRDKDKTFVPSLTCDQSRQLILDVATAGMHAKLERSSHRRPSSRRATGPDRARRSHRSDRQASLAGEAAGTRLIL